MCLKLLKPDFNLLLNLCSNARLLHFSPIWIHSPVQSFTTIQTVSTEACQLCFQCSALPSSSISWNAHVQAPADAQQPPNTNSNRREITLRSHILLLLSLCSSTESIYFTVWVNSIKGQYLMYFNIIITFTWSCHYKPGLPVRVFNHSRHFMSQDY